MVELAESDEITDLRTAVGHLVADYDTDYWRAVTEEGRFPTAF